MTLVRNFHVAAMLVLLCCCALLAAPVRAHHSFAIYDFRTMIPFDGVVVTLNFRNPHIEMTLRTVDANGREQIIDFVEGPPASMYTRSGLQPQQIAPGTRITAIGSPQTQDPGKFYLRMIRLQDGSEY